MAGRPIKGKKKVKPKKRLTGLNAMQEMFCNEFISDEKFNGLQACIRAGYSKKTAQQQASKLLSLVKVQNRIAQLMSDRMKRVEINADYVLKRLVEIDSLDILDIVDIENDQMRFNPLKDWPKKWRTSISGIDIKKIINTNSKDEDIETLTSKIKWPDKTKNLELLGKHIDISAFTENVKVTSVEEYEIPEGTTPQDAANAYLDAMKNDS